MIGTLAVLFFGFLLCVVFLPGSRKDLAIGFTGAVAISLLDLWAISQSRSSTAAVGLLFTPILAGLTFLALWIASRAQGSSSLFRKRLGYLGYAVVLGLTVWILKNGFETRTRNAARDELQKVSREAHEEKRRFLKHMLNSATADRTNRLEQFIMQHEGDDQWIAAALEFEEVTSARLEKIALSKKFEVRIVSHENAAPQLIERLYREHPNKAYLAPAVARSKNSPEPLLRELDLANTDRSLDNSFVSNPSAPIDILERISKTANSYQMQQLLENRKTNCLIAQNLGARAPEFEPYYQKWITDRLPTVKARVCGTSD